jgi:cell division septation protein DedD
MQMTRKGLLVYVGLMFFVAVWMFVLGILVGRGTIPVDLKIEAWKTEFLERQARMAGAGDSGQAAPAAEQPGQRPELGFYEALRETASGKNHKVDMPPAGTAQSPPEPAEREKPRQPRKAPKASEKNLSAGAAGPAAGAANRFTVQVAALKEAQGARKLVDDLRSKGYPAYQVKSESTDNSVWFRVRVGAFSQRDEAEALLKKLKGLKINGLIVRSQ